MLATLEGGSGGVKIVHRMKTTSCGTAGFRWLVKFAILTFYKKLSRSAPMTAWFNDDVSLTRTHCSLVCTIYRQLNSSTGSRSRRTGPSARRRFPSSWGPLFAVSLRRPAAWAPLPARARTQDLLRKISRLEQLGRSPCNHTSSSQIIEVPALCQACINDKGSDPTPT